VTALWPALLFASLGNRMVVTDQALGAMSGNWLQVREQTTCEAMQDESCLGRYGFAIHRDGTFLAGPSGEGGNAEGRIKPRELQQLEALMRRILPDAPGGQIPCKIGGPPGIRDQLDVTFMGESVVRIYDLGGSVGKLCYRGSRHDVERLHQYVHKLMTRYYPIPFPKT
jgi:hypothetical protein